MSSHVHHSHDLNWIASVISCVITCVLSCTLSLSTVRAENTDVTLENVSAQRLAQLREPALIDADLLQERVRQLKAGLKALTHMSEMIREAHARRALSAQVTALEATLSELEAELKETIKVSYQLSASPESASQQSTHKRAHPSERSAPAFIDEPIGGARERRERLERRERRERRDRSASTPSHTSEAPRVIHADPSLHRATSQELGAGARDRARDADLHRSAQSGASSSTRDEAGSDRAPKRAMSAAQLSRYWSAIEAAAFRDDKMKVIQRVAREAYLTVAQAEVLIESLTFSRDRKEAILSLYPRLTDPDEVQSLYRLLDHSSHRRDVRRRVRQLGARRQP